MQKFVAVALVLLVTACSHFAPLTSKWESAYGPNFPQPNPGQAAVYLIRDTAPEGAPPINLSIGRRPIGGLTSQTWMLFNLDPRLYDIHAFGTQTNSEQIITVMPGQTRFLLIQPTDSGGTEIIALSPADGRRLVRAGQHVLELNQPPKY